MKKNRTAFRIAAVVAGALVSLLASSCHDVIFDDIRKEVKLEDAQVSGSINSIVRYLVKNVPVETTNDDGTVTESFENIDYLFTQTGRIWKKDASYEKPHGWSEVKKPESDADYKYVNKLAADSDYLYAQLTLINEDTDDEELESSGCQLFYSADGGESWNPVSVSLDGTDTDTFASGSAVLFCTNAIKNEHRKAFVKISYTSSSTSNTKTRLFELNGGTASDVTETYASTDLSSGTDDDDEKSTGAKSCAYFNGNYYFSSSLAMVTDESADADATYIYYSSGDIIYYSADGTISDGKFADYVDVGCSTIYSMSLTKDYLYLGTADGIEHVAFEKDENDEPTRVPTSSTSDFSTNAASALSSYYEVNCVLAVDPTRSESANAIYGTSVFSGSPSSTGASQSNVGLWAYFSSRGSWNLE
ncbi:hypothetical protein [Treponema saccharophilum]|uniref:Lipoprotein n=1 Tax=Treponema saccharophilum DSM 2985 TaxID=907348 RepID=H7EIR2_9SPIR|nr:hypothetical protein [Treponema saccharophilum]EIC02490.1 hypothetical protein TresaDRAFT_2368 [Treponema saccharophilum DSM 2985]BDC96930.1 hypothetical protein TRSA_20290 [Treponema saccharophilum]